MTMHRPRSEEESVFETKTRILLRRVVAVPSCCDDGDDDDGVVVAAGTVAMHVATPTVDHPLVVVPERPCLWRQ